MAHQSMPDITSLNNNNIPNNNNNNTNSNVPLERRCDNPDCTVYKMVSNVPKRKTAQFVTDPVVMEKPLLINGFTTIFQIEGQSAKLSDIKNPDIHKPLYRIVPNTHAHIVNYVVVDSDAESLRKINENDPATMRKLLDSQKQSADQMLKKLIAGHNIPINIAPTSISVAAASAANSTTLTVSNSIGGINTVNSINPVATSKLMAATSLPAIQHPSSVHPNLKITAVASADGLSNISTSSHGIGNKMNTSVTSGKGMTTTPVSIQSNNMPLITPVPLANLQRVPPQSTVVPITSMANLMPTQTVAPMPSVNSPMSSNLSLSGSNSVGGCLTDPEKSNFDKMQQELKELRRTVALLAEAQAKNK